MGIVVANMGVEKGERSVKMSWSPMLEQSPSVESLRVEEVNEGVLYSLFLGYNDNSLDMFSSLCQLEEAIYNPENPKRCLKTSRIHPD